MKKILIKCLQLEHRGGMGNSMPCVCYKFIHVNNNNFEAFHFAIKK